MRVSSITPGSTVLMVPSAGPRPADPTTYGIGEAFLTQFVLPFELASMVLLAALIGSVVLSRKELKDSEL